LNLPDEYNFNNIIKEIIKNSLFTERQIEIILKQKGLASFKFPISKGAYYRQVNQSNQKLTRFYYSIILLHGLNILLPGSIDVMSKLSEHISVIRDSDVFPEKEKEVLAVINKVITQASKL